ncbi:hypothetical protein ASF00_09270 [Sphingomonas sp. Leaf34]|uniref:terminase small subunit-like protein n=1 Tax=Sphingomonas sp. Leaf34 TaxID=1736216 RepID=UPI000701949B|nr:hypothetical protein [Sphingomonas sp. Leaf34]KQN28088.1 hypothetical protein ASF00_09270 [Sphingomonas sp. Leaf34]
MAKKTQTTQTVSTLSSVIMPPKAATGTPAKTNPNQAQVALAPKVTNLIASVTRSRPGQPTKRNAQIEEELLQRIASGETMVAVCQDDHMPGYSTIQAWCKGDPSLLEAINDAYEWHARVLDDIVDDMLAGGPTSTGDFRRDEARAGHIRWRLGKLNKRFRDKTQVEQTLRVQTPVMPDWFFSNVVDGQLTDGSDPTI